jgi:hypothetical protein
MAERNLSYSVRKRINLLAKGPRLRPEPAPMTTRVLSPPAWETMTQPRRALSVILVAGSFHSGGVRGTQRGELGQPLEGDI